MIKKSVFEEELIAGMHRQLVKQATQQDCDNLEQAVDYLNSAAEIFENLGMTKNAEQIVGILEKIANKDYTPSDPRKISDRHTKSLTSEKMVKNLEQHGHPINLADDKDFSGDLEEEHTRKQNKVKDQIPSLVRKQKNQIDKRKTLNRFFEHGFGNLFEEFNADDNFGDQEIEDTLEVSDGDMGVELHDFEEERD